MSESVHAAAGTKGARQPERAAVGRSAVPSTPAVGVSGQIGAILATQRLVGNRATIQLLSASGSAPGGPLTVARQRRRRGQTITFSEAEGTRAVAHQSTVDTRLDRLHNQNAESIRLFFMNSRAGLDQFRDAMSFSSEQEAQPQIASAIGKAYFKFAIETLIDLIPEEVTKTVVKGAIAIGTAAWEEEQRAAAAAGERTILAFIARTRSDLARAETETLTNFRDQQLRAFLASYPGQRTSRVVEESEEAWIVAQQRAANVLRRRIPDNRIVQQQLTERFADTGAMVGYVTRGTWRRSGTLTLGIEVSGSRRDGWRVTDSDDKWILHTSAPRPERVAQSLKDSLEGHSPLFSTLPKQVSISASGADGDVSGTMIIRGALERNPRTWFEFGRYQRDPQRRQLQAEVMNSIGRSGPVATALLARTNIEGSED